MKHYDDTQAQDAVDLAVFFADSATFAARGGGPIYPPRRPTPAAISAAAAANDAADIAYAFDEAP